MASPSNLSGDRLPGFLLVQLNISDAVTFCYLR